MEEILNTIYHIIKVMIGIGIIVFVHEFGHFIFAKLAKVKVEIFSLGFGPRLFGFKKDDTDYRISLLPFVSYVKMAGESPFIKSEGKDYELASKSATQRFLIFFAGSGFNFLFAIPTLFIAFLIGLERHPAEISNIRTGSFEFYSPIQQGDIIKEIDGTPIKCLERYTEKIIKLSQGDTVKFKVERDGKEETFDVKITGKIESRLGLQAIPDVIINSVEKNSPAYLAGIRPNDKIVSVDDIQVNSWWQFEDYVKNSNGKELTIKLLTANKEEKVVKVKPTIIKSFTTNYQKYIIPASVGLVKVGSPADKSGLKKGDKILRVQDIPVETWTELTEAIQKFKYQELKLLICRKINSEEQTLEKIVKPVINKYDGKAYIGIASDELSNRIDVLKAGSIFDKAGFKVGDKIQKIDNKEINSLREIESAISGENAKRNAKFEILREGSPKTLNLELEEITISKIGVSPRPKTITEQYDVLGSFLTAVSDSCNFVGMNFLMIKKLFTGELSAKGLAGPIGIAQASYSYSKVHISRFLWFLAFISVALSVVNMLPIPMVDGGHIMFLIIEKIRGKPLNEKFIAIAHWIGLAIIISLFILATSMDISRFF